MRKEVNEDYACTYDDEDFDIDVGILEDAGVNSNGVGMSDVDGVTQSSWISGGGQMNPSPMTGLEVSSSHEQPKGFGGSTILSLGWLSGRDGVRWPR